MDSLREELRQLKEQQRSDFEAVMLAMSTQRDALRAYQDTTTRIMDRMEVALATQQLESEARFRRVEERLDRLEGKPPAA